FAVVAAWNRRHPREPMTFAYAESEWPAIDRWELPVFYFFRDGKLAAEVVGWPRGGRKPQILRALQQIGLVDTE
ncbi:MAG TPA: hypothetical protein VMH02_07220, partial [Verrucomicrobiae bacterium]|nr:hypothetical protein [Verrucomicrobiae bacterium]